MFSGFWFQLNSKMSKPITFIPKNNIMAITVCSSIGEVTVTSNDSDVIFQVTSFPNDSDNLLLISIDVTSIRNFYK